MQKSYIYILSNKNKTTLYVGVTSNLVRRIGEHKNGNSTFTRKYNVNELMYFEEFLDLSLAIKREKQLKTWHSEWKWNLVKEGNPDLVDLYDDLSL
ncbi:GIY-YIG nuclease family protein [Lutibacter sp. TH_r2]|uniref:GIY-YIG nuclease family protein n=1 Tax=Lutibacter sp. TH_r2 TaxID=3082083 RepID=UPI002954172B|nr:GIY-YIG nuclease family protein [Lutibacter sp. TH_r2]MDV7187786.1 GIY-YIG nuclease family protein [Lutibacter sp. TH_r2]